LGVTGALLLNLLTQFGYDFVTPGKEKILQLSKDVCCYRATSLLPARFVNASDFLVCEYKKPSACAAVVGSKPFAG
jgi:hypothetical protein